LKGVAGLRSSANSSKASAKSFDQKGALARDKAELESRAENPEMWRWIDRVKKEIEREVDRMEKDQGSQ
jgi:hypothetical protein